MVEAVHPVLGRQNIRKGNRQKKNTVDGDTGNDKGDVCGGGGGGGQSYCNELHLSG